jgi:hypothetical protein
MKPWPPRYFIEYAVRKDLRPFWLDALIETGFRLESDKAPPVANQTISPVSGLKPRRPKYWRPSVPMGMTSERARNPVSSQIMGNLVGKSFPNAGSQFDKAWIRLRASGQIVG